MLLFMHARCLGRPEKPNWHGDSVSFGVGVLVIGKALLPVDMTHIANRIILHSLIQTDGTNAAP